MQSYSTAEELVAAEGDHFLTIWVSIPEAARGWPHDDPRAKRLADAAANAAQKAMIDQCVKELAADAEL